MQKIFSFLFLIGTLVIGSSFAAAENSDQKTIPLFNGQNLDGWYKFLQKQGKDNDPDKVFTVENGVIHVSGTEFGCITTNEEYENYTLEVEYRVGQSSYGSRKDKPFDSGILLHSRGQNGAYGGVWMNSIEVQVMEGDTGSFYVVCNKQNDDFQITVPAKDGHYDPEGEKTHGYTPGSAIRRSPEAQKAEKPRGEWNLVRMIAKGDTIEVYLNGLLVNRAENVKPQRGRIQIQSEGAEFFYKRIDLTPL
ncbi:MAG: DUF1080 domain-containing protein [Planctomycetaceae bacterium]|jgi:hypothetical protein|nr:DUF1080 domain-containing protein [Planctomycetaceae bacterium]